MKIKIFQIIFLKAKIGLPFTCYDDFQRAAEGGGHMSAGERRQVAAEALGIGCVWINQIRTICQAPTIREILDAWEIPSNHVIYGMAALGYRDDTPIQPKERIGKVNYIR